MKARFIRFDNIKGSSWFNFKFGKFELDNLISEKRYLFLSDNGGLYQIYHFNVPGTTNDFGYGDNQLGIELAGHSKNSYTRYSVSMLSSNEGTPGLSSGTGNPSNRGYDVNLAFSQAFNTPGFSESGFGLQRVGAFAYIGQRPTYYETSGGTDLVGLGNKPFYRIGVAGDFSYKNLELMPLFMYGHDNAYLGTATPSNSPTGLPGGAQAPTFHGGFLEAHYYFNPQNVLLFRFEKINVGSEAFAGTAGDYGNVTAYSAGYRWYPIMFSRAGVAFDAEYSITKSIGIIPESGDGAGLPPLFNTDGVWSSSIFLGFDFDF